MSQIETARVLATSAATRQNSLPGPHYLQRSSEAESGIAQAAQERSASESGTVPAAGIVSGNAQVDLRQATSNVLVTVLMPCLNEARTLAACIQQAHAGCQVALEQRHKAALEQHHDSPRPASGRGARGEGNVATSGSHSPDNPECVRELAYEILIADNGSTDGSPEIATANGARVVHVEQKGYGAALRGGIAAARGKYIVMGDSDYSYDFGEVPRFLDKLEEGYDLVMGNRFAGGIMPGAMPWHHRYIGNPVLSGIGRLLYRTPCRDWHCGLRGFDRERILSLGLSSPGMEFASEMVILAIDKNMRVTEVPIVLRPDDRDRPPHLRSIRDGIRHLILMMNLRASLSASIVRTAVLATGVLIAVLLGVYASNLTDFTGDASNVGILDGHFFKDFGEVAEGELLTHSFPLRVVGSHSIVITNIRTSCQCMFLTSDDLLGKELRPGEEFSVDVGMNVGGAINEQKALASIEYVSGNNHQIANLKLSATIPSDYRLTHGELLLGTLMESDPTRVFTVRIINDPTALAPIVISNVICDDPRVSLEFKKGGDSCQIAFSQPVAEHAETITTPVIVETTSKRKIRSVVYISGRYEPLVTIEPSSVLVGSGFVGETYEAALTLRTSKPARIDAESHQLISVDVVQENELLWAIKLRFSPSQVGKHVDWPISVRFADGTLVVRSVSVVSFLGETK